MVHIPSLLLFCFTACSRTQVALFFEHCGHSSQVLDSDVGEIRSSAYHTYSYHFGATYDCWTIKGSVGEPVVLSFSQFSARCRNEWLAIKSSGGGTPLILCGSKLPPPVEFPGGNITVVHHFLPQVYPVSSFRLNYARDATFGQCPRTSFKCPGGRCLPLSWRCNDQAECLGEGAGADEEGCGAEGTPPGAPERNGAGDWREPSPSAKSHGGDRAEELLALLKERQETPATAAPVSWPCGGLLRTFYGTFCPPSLRGPPLHCVWTLDPDDSRPLKLDLQQLVLGRGDTLTIHNGAQGEGDVIKIITSASNYKSLQVESRTGLLSLTYQTAAGSEGGGFNATFHVGGYCPPWEGRCGGASGGCFTQEQRCDGKWDCPESGRDEEGCRGCGRQQFACGVPGGQRAAAGRFAGRPVCYPASERCNYQLYCADGSDERDCTVCQPGTFHCDTDRCVFESWRCDGQVDCHDGTDELNCTVVLPRKVITAATVGSLVCGLLLVVAMGCTCKLYSLRSREYSMFAPINRHEAQLIQQQAPPSYGQLIAQGVIPPVEDFPTENPNQTSTLSLRGILQLLRQDAVTSPHRRRRPRVVRRLVRRMRRWGLIPRQPSRPSQTAGQRPPDAAPPDQEPAPAAPGGSSSSAEGAQRPAPQKVSLSVRAPPASRASPPPPPPYAPPAEAPQTPPVAVPAGGPSLASILHTLGLSLSLFRASPPSGNSAPLSASPDDDVLLTPLCDDDAASDEDDDVPLLT
ncbi:low-density lipoprotein receptor-related protein 10 [Syngnathus scovelli]|uniref:low-density lipoprotein receptor-related protein 10 n=1 Tax=Syngnathus scovelli TaxID=161590 RepID=UPI002110CF53|nr:low-density lipoprotein receptor-related protein 10 [Syngnathus scovelli]